MLNAKNHAREALIIAEAGAKGAVTVATNMAGRGTDIKLGGNPEFRARKRAGTNATPEQFAKALEIEKELWKKDNEEVKACGGLYVIGSERHESRRIDNQLRGRSGRQGDPGRSKFFISMDDDLMRLFGGEKLKAVMSRIGMSNGEPLDHTLLNKSIENAQKKVEQRNFDIRKNLLDYDDVLNKQRSFIYEQRDQILVDNDLSKRIMNTATEEVEYMFENFKGKAKDEMAGELIEEIKNKFGLTVNVSDLSKDSVLALLQNDITSKEMLAGKQNLNLFIRYQYIQLIDKKWLDQLEYLDALREAVHLRSYGSKNPLTEYKNDGFDEFDRMLDKIRLETAGRIFKVKIQTRDESEQRQRQPTRQMQMNTQHAEANSMSNQARESRQQATNTAMKSGRQGSSVTVVRTTPKIGRNDPCPCGSGKKYKNCCGRN